MEKEDNGNESFLSNANLINNFFNAYTAFTNYLEYRSISHGRDKDLKLFEMEMTEELEDGWILPLAEFLHGIETKGITKKWNIKFRVSPKRGWTGEGI